jgi:hypothetical protein
MNIYSYGAEGEHLWNFILNPCGRRRPPAGDTPDRCGTPPREKVGIPVFFRGFSFFCVEKEKMEQNALFIVITYKIPKKAEKISNNKPKKNEFSDRQSQHSVVSLSR